MSKTIEDLEINKLVWITYFWHKMVGKRPSGLLCRADVAAWR